MEGPPDPGAGTRLERVLASGTFAVTTEVTPPLAASPEPVVEAARTLRGCADACNVTDGPRALVRMSALAASVLLLREGLEPVLQVAARDRNRIAIQADLLGAHALGVRNVLFLRGDEPSETVATVYELSTEQLLQAAHRLRSEGKLLGGDALEMPPRFFLGATVNPLLAAPEDAVINLRGKVDAGADFLQTQAVFDLDAFEDWMALVRKEWLHEKASLLAGILVVGTSKTLRFVGKLPGVVVPKAVQDRLARAPDPAREGVRLAAEAVDRLRKVEGIRGVHLMSVGRPDLVVAVAREAGLLPRPDLPGQV